MSEETVVAFKGELQLLGWTESDKGGRTVKFQCSGDEDDHPFKGFRSKARFAVVLVEIGDDEQPVKNESTDWGMSVAQVALPSNQAAMLCKDKDFWTWMEGRVWGVPVTSEKKASEVLKDGLGIESRSELDDDPALAQRFVDEILAPFREWQRIALAARKA